VLQLLVSALKINFPRVINSNIIGVTTSIFSTKRVPIVCKPNTGFQKQSIGTSFVLQCLVSALNRNFIVSKTSTKGFKSNRWKMEVEEFFEATNGS